MKFEYKVVPAPKKGKRAKGIRNGEDKFANALSEVMNEHGADGWQYLRTDTLPVEARTGLAGKATVFQNMMVFQRISDAEIDADKEVVENHAPPLPSPIEVKPISKDVSAPEITEVEKHD